MENYRIFFSYYLLPKQLHRAGPAAPGWACERQAVRAIQNSKEPRLVSAKLRGIESQLGAIFKEVNGAE